MAREANERSPGLVDRLRVALSDVRDRNRRVRHRLGRALDASLLGAGIDGVDRALEHSRLAAWFRRPPDGPVSVDLAESSVAGPLVALLAPLLRSIHTASSEATAASALGSLRPSGGSVLTDTVRPRLLDPTRVASALALGGILVVAASRGFTADPIALAAVALLATAALLGVVAGPRTRLRGSAVGRVFRQLRGEAPQASDRSR